MGITSLNCASRHPSIDKRSWPWKKKALSDKQNIAPVASAQISTEPDRRLTELEDQVKSTAQRVQDLEDEVEELNGKLSEARLEIINKDNLVKQHGKVAEEAVSGWEKAEEEAAMLKNQLESVTLLKLTAEDQASHLDGALKECMRQTRDLRDEYRRKLDEVIVDKAKLFDKMKIELESRIGNLGRELQASAVENAALSRSLQERSDMLIQAESEMELLKSNIHACEKEVSSLKYELHIARKELEIRNEEKNMSVRSAEVANKQHLEAVKKIAKLEGECERLRSLVRKKLPGPAALAQMKLEVENMNRGNGESRVRRSPVKSPTIQSSQLPEFSMNLAQKYQKENEILVERLVAIDGETKTLKEALANSNSELQESRNICTKMVSKFQSLEAQQQANSPVLIERYSSPKATDVSRSMSVSEYGNEDKASSAGSWSTLLMYSKQDKKADILNKSENMNHVELMDDFLVMEKLASNGTVSGNKDSKFKELETALCDIYNFVMVLGKEANKSVTGTSATVLKKSIDMFSAKYCRTISSEIKLDDFVLGISRVISKTSELHLNLPGYESSEVETSSPDCIDKIALLENKAGAEVDSVKERYPNCCARAHFPDSASNPDTPHNENVVPISESAASSWKYSSEEFEQLKMERDNLVVELAGCRQDFEAQQSQLLETKRLLSDAKSQLLSAEKSNSLAGTQLKCMAESYRTLENRAEELKAEVNLLQGKLESLETERQVERRNHQNALTRCQYLQEQLQRDESENGAACNNDDDNSQEKDLAAAAEKVAECQETIFLLSEQLKTLRPQTDLRSSPRTKKHRRVESSIEDSPRTTSMKMQEPNNPFAMEAPAASDLYNVPLSPSDSEANNPLRLPKQSKHRHTKSDFASMAFTTTLPEKQGRALSRFFSLKGKKVPSC